MEFQENEEASESNSNVPDLIDDPDSDDSDSETIWKSTLLSMFGQLRMSSLYLKLREN